MPERGPEREQDVFLDNLRSYMHDVAALDAEGNEMIENNRIRLANSFDTLLENLGVPNEIAMTKLMSLLPLEQTGVLEPDELVLQYKVAPLRLLDQKQTDCALPLEKLTAHRIEMIFDVVLAGEEVRHGECITGEESDKLMCDHNLTCPMKLGRVIGKDLLQLMVVQRHFSEDDVEPQHDPTFFNLIQLGRTLITHELMTPEEINTYRKLSEQYAFEQLTYITPQGPPRAHDETDEN